MKKSKCPDCGSDDLYVIEETMYELNTDEFFCHLVKSFDADARVECGDCDWKGFRYDVEKGDE
jgi:hypothetical protein